MDTTHILPFPLALEKLRQSEFYRSVTVLISGNVLAQAITIVTVPIVSRIYQVQAFGEYAIFASTASIIGNLAALGMASAIMAPKDEIVAKDIFFTAIAAMLCVTTTIFGASIAVSAFYRFFTISIPYGEACILLYVYILLNGLSSVLCVYANRLKRNRVLFWNTMISACATLCITIPLGLMGWGVTGFITASICAGLAANIQMLLQVNPFYKRLSMRQMASIFREYKEFVRFQFPANLLSNFSMQLPSQIFSAAFGNTALGAYAMCERVMGYPVRLIAAPISTIFFRHATQFVQAERTQELGAFTISLINKILLTAFVPVVIFIGASEKLFTLMLGSKWGPAGQIASILTIQYVFIFCNQCLSYCLVVLSKQKMNFYISIVQVVLIALSITIGIYVYGSILGAILIYGVGDALIQICYLFLNLVNLNIGRAVILRTIFLFVAGALAASAGLRLLIDRV